jgi:hypothetical protein
MCALHIVLLVPLHVCLTYRTARTIACVPYISYFSYHCMCALHIVLLVPLHVCLTYRTARTIACVPYISYCSYHCSGLSSTQLTLSRDISVGQINTIKPHSQLNFMCIYCTRTLTTCFGFSVPSSSEFHIQYTKLQAKCYKFYKYLKLVLKHI